MNHEIPPTRLSRTAMVAGAALALLGVGWLIYLSTSSSSESVASPSDDASAPVTAVTPDATVTEPAVATRPPRPVKTVTALTDVNRPPRPVKTLPLAPASEADDVAPDPAEVPEGAADPVPEGAALPSLAALEPWLLVSSGMGTRSGEFSAITVNEELNRILIADDGGNLFEFDLAEDGTPIEPARRTLRVTAGAGDLEGIAWMSGTTYVIAHENDGFLTVVEIADDATEVAVGAVQRTIDTGVREVDGNGLEGVAYLANSATVEFAVVQERPSLLHLIGPDGTIVSSIALDLPDLSAVWADSAESLVVVSHEARRVVALRLDGAGQASVVEELDLALSDGVFDQPEGLTRTSDGTRLYVVGELTNTAPYVFGLWRAPQ